MSALCVDNKKRLREGLRVYSHKLIHCSLGDIKSNKLCNPVCYHRCALSFCFSKSVKPLSFSQLMNFPLGETRNMHKVSQHDVVTLKVFHLWSYQHAGSEEYQVGMP